MVQLVKGCLGFVCRGKGVMGRTCSGTCFRDEEEGHIETLTVQPTTYRATNQTNSDEENI